MAPAPSQGGHLSRQHNVGILVSASAPGVWRGWVWYLRLTLHATLGAFVMWKCHMIQEVEDRKNVSRNFSFFNLCKDYCFWYFIFFYFVLLCTQKMSFILSESKTNFLECLNTSFHSKTFFLRVLVRQNLTCVLLERGKRRKLASCVGRERVGLVHCFWQ